MLDLLYMKAGKYILIIIGIGIIGFVLYALMQPDTLGTSVFNSDGEKVEKEMIIPATYTNAAGESVNVEYNNENNTAVVVRNGEKLVLNHVISASGARYANEDESYVAWNKGNEITLFENDEIVFTGNTDVNAYLETDTSSEEVSSGNINEQASIDAALVGTWQWEKTEMNSAEGINPQPKSNKFTLSFAKDGTVLGTTDCNSFGGKYSVKDGLIDFGSLATTLMFCEDSQEGEFLKLINDVKSYMINDNGKLVLMIKYDSGSLIFGSAEKDQAQTEDVSFTGILKEVNTGCFADGECYIMVNDKHVTVIMGWSQEIVGSIIGADGFGDLTSFIGKPIEVFAAQKASGDYTLYGSADYYIKVK